MAEIEPPTAAAQPPTGAQICAFSPYSYGHVTVAASVPVTACNQLPLTACSYPPETA